MKITEILKPADNPNQLKLLEDSYTREIEEALTNLLQNVYLVPEDKVEEEVEYLEERLDAFVEAKAPKVAEHIANEIYKIVENELKNFKKDVLEHYVDEGGSTKIKNYEETRLYYKCESRVWANTVDDIQRKIIEYDDLHNHVLSYDEYSQELQKFIDEVQAGRKETALSIMQKRIIEELESEGILYFCKVCNINLENLINKAIDEKFIEPIGYKFKDPNQLKLFDNKTLLGSKPKRNPKYLGPTEKVKKVSPLLGNTKSKMQTPLNKKGFGGGS